MRLRDEYALLRHGRDWRGRSTVPRSAERWSVPPAEREFHTGWARTKTVVALRGGLRGAVMRPVVWSQTAPVVEGTEYLDGLRGPAVFIANHSSHLDTPLILGSLPKRFADKVATGAAADYFFDVRWRAVLTAVFFNAFPVERYGSRKLRSLAVDLVDDGWSLLLYPEGTRSVDGWMAPFKYGAPGLCVTKNIPAVPISLRGSYAAMPRGRNWPRPGRQRIAVRYGRPLYPAEGEGVREFRNRMMAAVAGLAAEEEMGWYRARRAAADGSLPIAGRAAEHPAPVDAAGNDVLLPIMGKNDRQDVATWRRTWTATKPLSDGRRRRVWRW